MLEAVIGAVVGAVLGAVLTWIVARSERLKAEQAASQAAAQAAAQAEQAASRAAAQAANWIIAAKLAQKLGSMCSPYTPDSISRQDVEKMRRAWAEYTVELRLNGSNGAISDGAISDVTSAVSSYIVTLAEFKAGKVGRGNVEEQRDRALTTARIIIFPKAA
jgi:type II secretory pathway pseudopilin PulG